jgi:hypothetical protein
MVGDVLRKLSHKLEFYKKSSLDGSNLMLHDDWLDIPYVRHSFVLFTPDLKRLVARILEGIFSQLYPYTHFTRTT